MGNNDWAREALGEVAREHTGPTDADINRLIAEAELAANDTPAVRIAEHTGDRTYVIADDIADCLHDSGVDRLTSAQRLLIASILHRYGV